MWSGTAVWLCPALCGCEVAIEADWVRPPKQIAGRAISYAHPIPGSVRALGAHAVCAAHAHFRTDPLPADPYGGSPGYLAVPAAPGPTEKLYIRLFRYVGNRFQPDTCECRIYLCHDRLGLEPTRTLPHLEHTRKCRHHALDDDQHTHAQEENQRKNRAVGRLREQLPALTDDDVAWSFDEGTRRLVVTARGARPAERQVVQAWCDATLGADQVLIG